MEWLHTFRLASSRSLRHPSRCCCTKRVRNNRRTEICPIVLSAFPRSNRAAYTSESFTGLNCLCSDVSLVVPVAWTDASWVRTITAKASRNAGPSTWTNVMAFADVKSSRLRCSIPTAAKVYGFADGGAASRGQPPPAATFSPFLASGTASRRLVSPRFSGSASRR